MFVAAFHVNGHLAAIAGAIAALAILATGRLELPNLLKPLAYLGAVSYSLYLVHTPTGSRVINLSTRLPDSLLLRYAAIVVATCVSVAAAIVFWRIVERPSQRWSKGSGDQKILSLIHI